MLIFRQDGHYASVSQVSSDSRPRHETNPNPMHQTLSASGSCTAAGLLPLRAVLLECEGSGICIKEQGALLGNDMVTTKGEIASRRARLILSDKVLERTIAISMRDRATPRHQTETAKTIKTMSTVE